MRFALVAVIWLVFVGGMWGYVQQRDARQPDGPVAAPVHDTLDVSVTLEITPTFSSEKDPFALDTGDGDQGALVVTVNGVSVPVDAALERGMTLVRDNVTGLNRGFNELYISAPPAASETLLTNGIRVRVLRQGAVIEDQTLWGEKGAVISGTIGFDLAEQKGDDHDH